MMIRKEQLQAALAATTGDDTRYFFDAVCVDAKGRVIGTDGNVAIVAECTHPIPDDEFPSVGLPELTPIDDAVRVLIPSDTGRKLLKAIPKKGPSALQHVRIGQNGNPDAAVAIATDLTAPTIATVELEGKGDSAHYFPNVDRVIPRAGCEPEIQVILGVPVLETLIKAAKAVNSRNPAIRFYIRTGENHRMPVDPDDSNRGRVYSDAIRIEIKGDEVTVVGVAMPMRL